jgi:hypothetical protein
MMEEVAGRVRHSTFPVVATRCGHRWLPVGLEADHHCQAIDLWGEGDPTYRQDWSIIVIVEGLASSLDI